MWEKILIYVFAPILSALLLWIGWLIKKQIDLKEAQRKQQEEYSLSMSKVSEYLDATVATLVAITETLKVSLQCHNIEFQSMHDSGMINGESVEQMAKISLEIARLEENAASIEKLREMHSDPAPYSPQTKEHGKETA